MRARLVVAVVPALICAVAAGSPAGPAPEDLVTRSLVLPDGGLELRLIAGINLQPRFMARPLSLSPEAWWGIAPRWTIGVIHSSASVDQIDASATFCVRESDVSPCDRLYRGGGLEVRYGAMGGASDGPLAVAPRLRALVRDIDPWKPAIALGALVRWTRGRYAVTSDPYVRLPLAHRTEGNRAALFVPVWFAVQPAPAWELALHVGYDAELAVLHDGWHGPLSLAVTSRITSELDVGVEAGWARLFGPQHDGRHGAVLITTDWRR